MKRSDTYQQIYAVVNRIPIRRVATYGQIAALAGYPGQARMVGFALNRLPDDLDIPWQRVINAKGQISARKDPTFEDIQQMILMAEGVHFDAHGRVDLSVFQWIPGK